MTKFLLTNEVIATELWKMLRHNLILVNLLSDAQYTLDVTTFNRAGQRVYLYNKVWKVSLWIHRLAGSSGTVYIRIRKVSDDSIISESINVIDVSTLPTSSTEYSFEFSPTPLVQEEVRVLVEYPTGSGEVYVRYCSTSGVCTKGMSTRGLGSSYSDFDLTDIKIKLYEPEDTLPSFTFSEDNTTKALVGKNLPGTRFKLRPGVTVSTPSDWPDISLAKSGWRTESPLNGVFSAGYWTWYFKFESDTKFGFYISAMFRVSKSANADGSSATLLFGGGVGIQIPASAGGEEKSLGSFNEPSYAFNNEYLFAEFLIMVVDPATGASAQCSFSCDEDPLTDGVSFGSREEAIDTPYFAPPTVLAAVGGFNPEVAAKILL